jgi:hypothetical protein
VVQQRQRERDEAKDSVSVFVNVGKGRNLGKIACADKCSMNG